MPGGKVDKWINIGQFDHLLITKRCLNNISSYSNCFFIIQIVGKKFYLYNAHTQQELILEQCWLRICFLFKVVLIRAQTLDTSGGVYFELINVRYIVNILCVCQHCWIIYRS